VAHSAFVHANLNWSLGPLRYVIAGPVFHRWHHTAADKGGSKNFAPTFPVLDIIFGTFHLPVNVLPEGYGVSDQAFPTGFGSQLMYPFKP
jgi:sterol desaturase/sphingolipid hydroxylase (fatty acid hydroxylase superfamily)